MNLAANRTIDLVLRALQVLLTIVVIGTGAYAISEYQGHTVHKTYWFGSFDEYEGVPAAWTFLMFCAGWTILGVIFLLIVGRSSADGKWIGYTCAGVEAVAMLSWLAGFIATAVNLGSTTCPAEEHHCGSIAAATAVGAVEWLLFVYTTYTVVMAIFYRPRGGKTSRRRTSRSQTSMPNSSIPMTSKA
ncbi:hypothetical protein M409DRAFT_71645 [Zasmidium cellare ATCC 36951]|uniref:MARVEL domain-containing protein n=1 Tax=Zasmidium cellare ATCC 36951 TaxID=1080233 RepID=A0A6A6BY01_ZASCE|nr:uncharacterized protein M409DRAFT_71645 [Zasmidium cellare ATCC 36951]KAF2158432.1 hypothetical protein M409DRAFT_71645 [Zasmidium cellare ATCC 36951]